MNFNSDASTDYEGFNIPTLAPNKYSNVELISVKLERPTNDAGEQLKRRIIFTFKTEDGQSHTHIEYDIDPNDAKAETKAPNLVKRVGHIMSKFVPKDQLTQANTSFSDYGKWVMATLGATYVGVKCDMIIVGNVYNGKATAGFPGYLPFIVKAGEPLGFDNNHLRSNKEYDSFMASAAEAPATTSPDQNGEASNVELKTDDVDF